MHTLSLSLSHTHARTHTQSAVARETLLELVITLTALSRALPTGRLVLFPQVRTWLLAAWGFRITQDDACS